MDLKMSSSLTLTYMDANPIYMPTDLPTNLPGVPEEEEAEERVETEVHSPQPSSPGEQLSPGTKFNNLLFPGLLPLSLPQQLELEQLHLESPKQLQSPQQLKSPKQLEFPKHLELEPFQSGELESSEWSATDRGINGAPYVINFSFFEPKGLSENSESKEEKRWIDQSEVNANAEKTSDLIKQLYLAHEWLGLGMIGNKSFKASQEITQLEKLSSYPPRFHYIMLQCLVNAMKKVADAQYKLGMAYFRGYCCSACLLTRKDLGLSSKSNDVEAVKWLSLASQQGHIGAEIALASCHYNGRGGIRENKFKARLSYQQALMKAQKNKDGDALCLFGELYYYGDDHPIDTKKAFKFFEESVAAGNTRAYFLLGRCYFYGIGCPSNDKKANAKKAFEILSKERKTTAQEDFYLACCYESGIGCKKDLVRAFNMFKKISTERTYLKARMSLANCYEKGKGCEKDLNEAFQWYKQAGSQGDMNRIRKLASSKLASSKCVIS